MKLRLVLTVGMLVTTYAHAQRFIDPPWPLKDRLIQHEWTISAGTTRVGLSQYRVCRDSDGIIPFSVRDSQPIRSSFHLPVTCHSYTTVYFGPLNFTVRFPAWPLAALFLGLLGGLLYLAFRRVKRLRTDSESNDAN